MKLLFGTFVFLVLFVGSTHAQIRINEFLIDPSQKIELFNSGLSPFDISGWFLDDSGGTTYFTVPQNTVLAPNSCTVFEADFNLNKTTADTVRLFSSTAPPPSTQSALIDFFSYKASSGSGTSFKRLPDGEGPWGTGPADLGFYNNTTLSCVASPLPTLSPSPTHVPTTTPAKTYDNIYISEIMINPDDGVEWVELYNDNDADIDLIKWYIDDQEDGGSAPKVFSLFLPARSYSVYNLSSSIFNNGGDSVRLLDPYATVKDSVSYATSEKSMSLGKILLTLPDLCLQIPSKGAENNACSSAQPEPSATPTIPLSDSILRSPLTYESPPPQVTPSVQIFSDTTRASKEAVAGISTRAKDKKNFSKPLSLITLSYSLLTIVAVFFKMKTGL